MTIYFFDNDNIIKEPINENVGWLSDMIHNKFDCMLAIRNVLQNHGHALNIKMFRGSIKEYEQVEPVIREVEAGFYITDLFDEINYAYFSKDMKCAKSCINAVLKVMSA